VVGAPDKDVGGDLDAGTIYEVLETGAGGAGRLGLGPCTVVDSQRGAARRGGRIADSIGDAVPSPESSESRCYRRRCLQGRSPGGAEFEPEGAGFLTPIDGARAERATIEPQIDVDETYDLYYFTDRLDGQRSGTVRSR